MTRAGLAPLLAAARPHTLQLNTREVFCPERRVYDTGPARQLGPPPGPPPCLQL